MRVSFPHNSTNNEAEKGITLYMINAYNYAIEEFILGGRTQNHDF